MMAKDNRILAEVEKTFQSLDNDITPAENPFLVTRLTAGRAHLLSKRAYRSRARTVVTYAGILVLLFVNLITAVYCSQRNSEARLREQLVSELKEDFKIDQSQINF